MEAGKDYYVAVEAPDWKKGVGTDYDLTVNGNVFNHAKNNLANNSYDQVKGQSVTPITGNADGTLSTTPLLADEWVGYGDAKDFFAFELDSASKVDLDLNYYNKDLRFGKDVKINLYDMATGKKIKLSLIHI